MANGWISVLQLIPWSDVISNAPKVADGAKKLWSAVGKKPPGSNAADGETLLATGAAPPTLEALEKRLQALEVANNELHGQMLASADLIKTLADQNTQLIKRIEVNRVRLVMLAVFASAVAIMAITSLALLSMR
jgi:hypothetical protein